MKRSLLSFGVLVTGGLLVLSGCAGSSGGGSDGNELVIYSAEEVAQDFADKYMAEVDPDLDIKVISGSSGESNARVVAEAGNPQGDLSFSGTDPASANPELYVKASELVDLSGVDERFIVNEFAASTMVYPLIYAYNKDQLKGDDAPETWEDLADPKWKGRLYMGNPATSEAAYKTVATLHSLGGWDLVEKVAANAIITEGSTDPMRALGNSEAAIGVGIENQVYKWADGETVVPVYPSDGMIMHIGTQYFIADGPNQQNAVDFMNWMLTPEFQNWMAEEYTGMRSSLTDAAPTDNVPSTDTLEILEFPEDAQLNRAEYVDHWKDIITSL